MANGNGKHTPGPWIAKGCYVQTYRNGALEIIANVETRPADEGDANARLIAAAPRMLEALRSVVASGGLQGANLSNAIGLARAILRDVEGAQ